MNNSHINQFPGWIKLHRNILVTRIWMEGNLNDKVAFIVILLKANYEANRWVYKGKEHHVEAGQFVTSLSKLGALCGLTKAQVRSSIDKLVAHGFITKKNIGNKSLITVKEWDLSQSSDLSGDTNNARKPASNKNIKNKDYPKSEKKVYQLQNLTPKFDANKRKKK